MWATLSAGLPFRVPSLSSASTEGRSSSNSGEWKVESVEGGRQGDDTYVCLCVVVVLLCNHNPFCCEHTVLRHCRLPHRDFVAGSSADVKINLRNDSSVDVRSISVRVSRVDLGMGCEYE